MSLVEEEDQRTLKEDYLKIPVKELCADPFKLAYALEQISDELCLQPLEAHVYSKLIYDIGREVLRRKVSNIET